MFKRRRECENWKSQALNMALDLTYLKKRAALVDDIMDDKVQSALIKIQPPKLEISNLSAPKIEGFDCIVKNKMMRFWIDLVPEKDRSFIRFIYIDGNDGDILKYLKTAMIKSAWNDFKAAVSKDQTDLDFNLMRYVVWNYMARGRPVGAEFGNFEMNQIVNALPMDVAKDKTIFDAPSLADFYKMIYYTKWALDGC